jgi:hypothetical protein
MSKTKTNLKIAAIALAIGVIGVIGVGQAQAAYNTKIGRNHTHSTSAATSIPALMVFGRAMNAVAEDPGAPNHEWAARAAMAFRRQVGWDYSPAAPDSGWKPWAEGEARQVVFANLWVSKLVGRLVSRTYSSPQAVLDAATHLLEHTDSARLQGWWDLAGQGVAEELKEGGITPISDGSNAVHFTLGYATYLANGGGWSIQRNNGIWFGGASGGQERIAGRVYTLDVRNGDEFSHGTDASQRMLGGN